LSNYCRVLCCPFFPRFAHNIVHIDCWVHCKIASHQIHDCK
jgi:hypothetical protein